MEAVQVENKELYDLIEKFLSSLKMSRRKFAKMAGIPPTTFQHKFETKSKIRSDLYMTIRDAMLRCVLSETDPETQDALSDIIDELDNAYTMADYIDPYIKRILVADKETRKNKNPDDIHQLENAWNEYLNHRDSQNYTVAERNCILSLQLSLDKLNETGLKIAAERVEELTKIPDYRKDNE